MPYEQLLRCPYACCLWSVPDVVEENFSNDDNSFTPSQVKSLQSYSTEDNQILRGNPLCSDQLCRLTVSGVLESGTFSLHINGFSFKGDETDISIVLSPFSVVQRCKFQLTTEDVISKYKGFTINLLARQIRYCFGITGAEADAEGVRSHWVRSIAVAIQLVTQSLFPPFSLSCFPISAVPVTDRRLLAGYLVHSDGGEVVSVPYCELHAPLGHQAKLVIYENELCRHAVKEIGIQQNCVISSRAGVGCRGFVVQDHQFSARTISERKLWMRALSNIIVKLVHSAPSPTHEELRCYRKSIIEQISLEQECLKEPEAMDPLLVPGPRLLYGPAFEAVCNLRATADDAESHESQCTIGVELWGDDGDTDSHVASDGMVEHGQEISHMFVTGVDAHSNPEAASDLRMAADVGVAHEAIEAICPDMAEGTIQNGCPDIPDVLELDGKLPLPPSVLPPKKPQVHLTL